MPYAFNPLTGQFDFYKDPTPGGTSGQVQFNNSGVLGGVSTTEIDGSGNLTFSGRWIQSTNGASNAAPYILTGTWFNGGTSTTTKPQLLIEPSGTTSTNWSTAGTGLGVNAPSGFPGYLLDLQVNGSRMLGIGSDGSLQGPNAAFVLRAFTTNSFDFIQAGQRLFQINYTYGIRTSYSISFAGGTDVNAGTDLTILRDAANTLAQRNGTAAQTYRVYNTYTSSTNFERLNIRWTSNQAIIDTEAGSGGGTLRGLRIGSAATSLLGFYSATPVAQPAAVADATDAASVITQLNLLLERMRTLGLIAT